jgi:hypothetical protein
MKIKLNIILILSVCFNQLIYSQITFPKDIDERMIVSILFEGNWSEKDSTFQWIPNLSESLQFGCEPKDTLRTKIDTVFNYKENSLKKIILTTTYVENSSCHACQPSLGMIELTLNADTDTYQIDQISKFITKYGTWGETPKKRGLLQIGEVNYCVKITEYSNGMGSEVGTTSLFKDGKKIFSFCSYDTNYDAVEFDYQKYKYSSTIFYDIKTNTIKITKSGKEFNELNKIVKVNSISTYKYDGEFLTKKSTKNILEKK